MVEDTSSSPIAARRAGRGRNLCRHPSETGIAAVGFICRTRGDKRSEIENLQRPATGRSGLRRSPWPGS